VLFQGLHLHQLHAPTHSSTSYDAICYHLYISRVAASATPKAPTVVALHLPHRHLLPPLPPKEAGDG
jgi:hypothetical protein